MGSSTSIVDYVRSTLSTYERSLNPTINLIDIEKSIELYDFTSAAKVTYIAQEWVNSSTLPIGTIIEPTSDNGYYYVVQKALFLSNATEPTWPTTVGSIVIDNDLIWECKKKSYTGSDNWVPSTAYSKHDIVLPTVPNTYQYQCIGYSYKTGSVEPTWPTKLGDVVIDGQILWVAVTKDIAKPLWVADTITEKSTIVNSTVNTNFSYQALNFVPTSESSEPSWSTESETFTSSNIEYARISKVVDIKNASDSEIHLDWSQYVTFDETIEVV
jgi:hypothetical protein